VEIERAMEKQEKPVMVVAAVIEREGKVLIARRHKGGIGGVWEFPGGKVRNGETPEHALERELAEELSIQAHTGEWLCTVPYRGEKLSLDLYAYRVELITESFVLNDHDELRWEEIARLDEMMFSQPDRLIIRFLLTGE